MGRAAKYHSVAERKAARREHNARYARSPLGQATKKAGRARRMLTSSTTPSPVTLEDIHIPEALRDYASMPFVMSYAFRDITGPALGLRIPPYTFRMPDRRSLDSLERRGSNDPLLVKLETLQFSWALAAGTQRKQEWMRKGDAEMLAQGVQELAARVRAWTTMELRMSEPGEGEQEILELAMRWGARLAMMLADELAIRHRGREAWMQATQRGEVPLQRLVKENRLRIEALPTDDEESGDE